MADKMVKISSSDELVCNPGLGCLTSESTSTEWFRNEAQQVPTQTQRTNQRFESTNYSQVAECKKDYSPSLEAAFESDVIQQKNFIEDSGTSCNDLRNVVNAKKLLQKGWCVGKENATEVCDFKIETSSLTQPTVLDNDNVSVDVESVESSPKKYKSLSVTLSHSCERKVVEQSFDLGFTTGNHFDKSSTAENKDANTKPDFENETFTNNLSGKTEKHNCCESPLKQPTPRPKDELIVAKEMDKECELAEESKNLFLSTVRVKDNKIERKGIKDLGLESSSDTDDDLSKRHPNRRLQVERTGNALDAANKECRKHLHPRQRQQSYKRKRSAPSVDCKVEELSEADQNCSLPSRIKIPKSYSNFKNTRKTKEKNSVFGKKSKSGELWSEVLSTPDLWKTEYNKKNIGKRRKVDFKINYCELLNRHISCGSMRKLSNECLTFWEERLVERLRDPNSMYYLMEFHIPPAQVEVFYQQLTDKLSHVECLRKVCESRRWPQPVYTHIPQSDVTAGFLYSCQLKTVLFTPTKCASNRKLAQELAADLCLDWLGLRLRRSSQTLRQVYSVAPSHSTATSTI